MNANSCFPRVAPAGYVTHEIWRGGEGWKKEARHRAVRAFFASSVESRVNWSRADIATLKMSLFWNDTAEDVAFILGNDVNEVQAKAHELGVGLKRLRDYKPTVAASPMQRTPA